MSRIFTLLTILVTVLTFQQAFANGLFDARRHYLLGEGPHEIAAGDFNEDGSFDFAVVCYGVNYTNSRVSLLLSNAAGEYEPVELLTGYELITNVAVGDLNADGHDDLVIAAWIIWEDVLVNLCVHFGDGTGGFALDSCYESGELAYGLMVADVDADSDLDVLSADPYRGKVWVMRNQGDGRFVPSLGFPAGPWPIGVDTADFDADDDLDLVVVGDGNNYIRVLYNDHTGAYLGGTTYNTAFSSDYVATGDFDGDGNIDFYPSGQLGDQVMIYYNDGDGNFGEPVPQSMGGAAANVGSGDFDNDGDLDLLTLASADDFVAISLGLGSGTFAPPFTVTVGTYPSRCLVLDVNGDGRSDIVTANSFGGDVSIAINGEGLEFEPDDFYPGTGVWPRYPCAADFDNDGLIDIALSHAGSHEVAILNGIGGGEFLQTASCQVGNQAGEIVAADLDGDGDIDLVTADYATTVLSYLANQGDGSFAAAVPLDVGSGARGLAVGDLDGDSDLDLVATNYSWSKVAVLINQGSGSFASPVYFDVGFQPLDVVLADFNGDSRLDIATANETEPGVSILLNLGDNEFAAATDIIFSELPRALSVLDLDEDLDLDLAVLCCSFSYDSGLVEILLNDGAGGFSSAGTVSTGGGFGAQDMAAGDLDGDGDLDLAISQYYSPEVVVLLNEGSGDFSGPSLYGTQSGPYGLCLADLDDDGDLDAAVGCHDAGGLDILFNLSAPAAYGGLAQIDPTVMHVASIGAVEALPGSIYLGNLESPQGVAQIDESSVRVNYSLQPKESELLESYPGFEGQVLRLGFDRRDFVADYGIAWDTTTQEFVVTGSIVNGPQLHISGSFTLIGHRRGDVDADGFVNITDAISLIRYIFAAGEPPNPWQVGDADCSGRVELTDVVWLVNYIFASGPAPCGGAR